ncbi:MAG: Gfo/Idh/MocA family oxidoreductase [Clostridia bacterium]|nr:Gfo/Idh/MocA family oxidoreductase [Clostridia bacterium]
MKNGKISIALVGAGRARMIHARNFAGSVPNAVMSAVADPVEEAAASAAAELGGCRYVTDYKELWKDDSLDAVVIATPTKYHCKITVDAAKAGKHVLCEKPMAMNVEECEQMEQAAKEHGIKLQMAFMRRFDAGFLAAKEAILAGSIGEVVMVRSNTRGPSIPKPWMYDISKSNGPLAEVNSHDIDSLRFFTESEFQSVHAIAGNYRCPDAKAEFPDFYDNVVMIGEMANGMQGMIDGAQGVRYGYDARTEILGTHGCIYLGKKNENEMVLATSDMNQQIQYVNSWKYLFKDAYLAEDLAFVNCILENSEPKVTGFDGKMAVKVVDAGNRSIREHCIVKL